MKELLTKRKEANNTELSNLVQIQQQLIQQLNAIDHRQAELQGANNEIDILIAESEKKEVECGSSEQV